MERFTLRHIKIKLLKDKEKMVKAVQQSDSIYKSSFEVRKQWAGIFKVLKEKHCQSITISSFVLQNKGKILSLPIHATVVSGKVVWEARSFMPALK